MRNDAVSDEGAHPVSGFGIVNNNVRGLRTPHSEPGLGGSEGDLSNIDHARVNSLSGLACRGIPKSQGCAIEWPFTGVDGGNSFSVGTERDRINAFRPAIHCKNLTTAD